MIPLIIIPVKSDYTLNDSIEKINYQIEQVYTIASPEQVSSGQIAFMNILMIFFILVSSTLLVRFIINIFRILFKIRYSKKVLNNKTTIVLINERILPYSFFKYIFVSRTDYEIGNVEQEFLLHEEAHCEQLHSIDIIVVELLNIVLWFNPAIWMLRKEILLNHEYSADNKVLNTKDSTDYQQLLLNVLLQNNANYLVSNFKFSSIKNRIIMITKSKPSNNAILRKATSIIVFLLIGIALTFSKGNELLKNNTQLIDASIITSGNEKPELFPIKKGEYSEIPRNFGQKSIHPVSKEEIVHYGIDIKAKLGTDVMATAGGKVIKAGWEDKGYGNLIVIDHGDNYQSLYAHLNDVNVKIGDIITKGQVIGHVGSTGLSTGPHLHFEISLKGDKVNPMTLLK